MLPTRMIRTLSGTEIRFDGKNAPVFHDGYGLVCRFQYLSPGFRRLVVGRA